jgi:hypothetical protein
MTENGWSLIVAQIFKKVKQNKVNKSVVMLQTCASFPSNFHIIVTDFFIKFLFPINFTMAERKKKVLLTANLKIALIKCSQELKNAYPEFPT